MKDVHNYTYTTRQLCLRDELVLKSIVRILRGQTQHDWHYDASPQSDLLIVGSHASSAGTQADVEPLHHPLTIDVGPDGPRRGHLTLPLRVGDVLVQLNHAGDVLTHLKDALDQQAAGSADNDHANVMFALLRWPAWDVLQQDGRYLRIATVLATGPSTISDLSGKTGVSFAVCEQLVRLLKLHDLIRTQVAAVSPVTDTAAALEHTQPADSALQKDASTLWHRIRRRLGLNPTHAIT